MDSNSSTNAGETIAELDGSDDVVVLGGHSDHYSVRMPDGNIVNTDGDGLDQLRNVDWSDYAIDEDWTEKPWEPDPIPDRDSTDPIGVVRPQSRTTDTEFRYECPNCEGKFKSWHRESGDYGEDDTYHCPFCMKQRGEFGPEDDEERIREIVREAMEEANRKHRLSGSGR